VKIDIMIQRGSNYLYPPVCEEITVDWERKGSPGKLSFKVTRETDGTFCAIEEGDAVVMQVDGKNFFFGFVFTKKFSKADTVAVTVYDQLRYLKNSDTYVYSKKTAADVVRMIALDFQLQLGVIEPTFWTIPQKVEDDTALFDIIQNALDETIMNTKKMYVLYDNFGKLCLQDVETMRLPLLLDGTTIEDFDYTSSIDSQTYNQVKVVHEDTEKEGGERKVYMVKDSSNIQQWGVLQLTDKVETAATGKQKAEALLQLYNRKTRTLSAKGVLGDGTLIRAGNSIVCHLDLGDTTVQNFMLVESVKHTFTQNQHSIDMKLRGGVITG
jgi:hypothetical protein